MKGDKTQNERWVRRQYRAAIRRKQYRMAAIWADQLRWLALWKLDPAMAAVAEPLPKVVFR